MGVGIKNLRSDVLFMLFLLRDLGISLILFEGLKELVKLFYVENFVVDVI